MLKQLEELKAELEEENFGPINDFEIEYLEQVKTKADVTNFSMATNERDKDLLQSLAYSVALVMGYTEDEAEAIADYGVAVAPIISREEVEKEYDSLVRDHGAAVHMWGEARYNMVEEMSAEGFVSKETRDEYNHWNLEMSKAANTLDSFKKAHPEVIAQIKKERAEANSRAVWNS